MDTSSVNPEELEKRVAALEELVSKMIEANSINQKSEVMDDAKVMAIYSFVQELAVREGVSSEAFLKHYETRFQFWCDWYLRQYENASQEVAAELDWRSVQEVYNSESYPLMFDPPQTGTD